MTGKKRSVGFILLAAVIGLWMVAGPVEAQVLRVYSHNETAEMEKWVPEAEKAIGMKIEWSPRLASNELWTRIQTETPNFNADLIWGS